MVKELIDFEEDLNNLWVAAFDLLQKPKDRRHFQLVEQPILVFADVDFSFFIKIKQKFVVGSFSESDPPAQLFLSMEND